MNTNKPSSKVFTSSGTIDINQPAHVIFSYLSDMANDQYWRDEVKKTTTSGRPVAGCLVEQQSELVKGKPLYLAKYVCSNFVADEEVTYETTTDNTEWQTNTRKCQPLSENVTRVHYSVAFEKNVIKKGMAIVPPAFFIDLFLKGTMKKYLQNLKERVENGG